MKPSEKEVEKLAEEIYKIESPDYADMVPWSILRKAEREPYKKGAAFVLSREKALVEALRYVQWFGCACSRRFMKEVPPKHRKLGHWDQCFMLRVNEILAAWDKGSRKP